MYLSKIKDNSIIICPSELKKEIIKEINDKSDLMVKFFSKKELMERVYFKYDDNAIAYLMKKGKSYSNAKEILNNLIGIKKGNDKLDELYELYCELDREQLLKKDYLIGRLFCNKQVYVIGYSDLDSELKNALKKINAEYQYIERESRSLRPKIHEFDTMDEEVNYIFLEIAKLVEKGISFNDIYLYDYPEEYDLIIKKYARYYNFPIEYKNELKLNETKVFKEYLTHLCETNDFVQSFSLLSDYEYNDFGAKQKLISIINNINNIRIEGIDRIDYFKFAAKNVTLRGDKYDEAIKIVTCKVIKNGYVFLFDFSQGNYPKISKDTDFLSDNEKEILLRNTSHINNVINEMEMTYYIENQENLFLCRKIKEGKETKFDTTITKKLELVKENYQEDGVRYCKELSEIEVAKYNDVFLNYGIDHELVDSLDPKSFSYREYDNRFKKADLFKNLDGKLDLSYSKINEYAKCPFMFFIHRMCTKIPFEDTFFTNLGNLFHKILEDSITKEINLSDYDEEINNVFCTKKDKFFINLLLPQVLNVIEKNKSFLKYSDFNAEYPEQDIKICIDDNTYLQGKIDKVVVNKKNKELFIVDYKTYNLSFDKEKVEYGLDLQLPIYSILLKEAFPSYQQVGIYIQNICEEKKSESNYLLKGITLNDEEVIHRLDHTLVGSSTFINGIKLDKSGIKSNSSLLTKQEYSSLISKAEEVVMKIIKGIRNGEFDISPIDLKGLSCDSCDLDAVCFHKERDTRKINIVKEKK